MNSTFRAMTISVIYSTAYCSKVKNNCFYKPIVGQPQRKFILAQCTSTQLSEKYITLKTTIIKKLSLISIFKSILHEMKKLQLLGNRSCRCEGMFHAHVAIRLADYRPMRISVDTFARTVADLADIYVSADVCPEHFWQKYCFQLF